MANSLDKTCLQGIMVKYASKQISSSTETMNYHELRILYRELAIVITIIWFCCSSYNSLYETTQYKRYLNLSPALNQLHIDAATSDWSIAVFGCNVTRKVALALRSVRKPPLSSNHNLCVKTLFILNLFSPKEQLPCAWRCLASLPRDTEKSTVRLSGLVLGKKTYVSVVSFYVQCFRCQGSNYILSTVTQIKIIFRLMQLCNYN